MRYVKRVAGLLTIVLLVALAGTTQARAEARAENWGAPRPGLTAGLPAGTAPAPARRPAGIGGIPPRTLEETVRALREGTSWQPSEALPPCRPKQTFPPGPDGQYFETEGAGEGQLRWKLVLVDHPLQWIPTLENYHVRINVGGQTVGTASWSWGDDPEGVVPVGPGERVELFAMGVSRSGQVLPNAWTAAAGACVERAPAPAAPAAVQGSITYGPVVAATGQRSSARAVITPAMIADAKARRIGSTAAPSIRPPGWNDTDHTNRARGHLIGRQFGGSGHDARNLITMVQNPANSPVMSGFEDLVAETVAAGEIVTYEVTPFYRSHTFAGRPDTIRIRASGNRGFRLDVVISNTEAAGVTVRVATPELPFDPS